MDSNTTKQSTSFSLNKTRINDDNLIMNDICKTLEEMRPNELLVIGYIRQFLIHYNSAPFEIEKLCILFYDSYYWNTCFVDLSHFILDRHNQRLGKKYNSENDRHYSNAFGNDRITVNTKRKVWTVKILQKDDEYEEIFLMIGIDKIDSEKIYDDYKQNTYAFCDPYHGGLHLMDVMVIYCMMDANGLKINDRVTMLYENNDDTKYSRKYKYGCLSFIVNGKNFGVAFDDIDIEKNIYRLAVAMNKRDIIQLC